MNKEKEAFIETGNYIYLNPVTRWITLKAHKACAKLRKFDNGLVVDLGCGRGDHFPFVNNSKVIGIDIVEELLEEGKRLYPKMEFRREDIFNLSFANESLMSIVSIGVLEHLYPLKNALREINKVMADDGELLFGIPTEGFVYRLGRKLTTKPHVEKTVGVDYDKLLKTEHVNKCKHVIDELKKNFIIDKLVGVPFNTPFISLNIFLVGRCIKRRMWVR